jgi:hypothetical protein
MVMDKVIYYGESVGELWGQEALLGAPLSTPTHHFVQFDDLSLGVWAHGWHGFPRMDLIHVSKEIT